MSERDQVMAEKFSAKVWRRLGFKGAYVPPPEDVPMFAPGSIMSETFVVFDWRDRLRLLISGKLVVMVRTQTDTPVELSAATSAIGILPPTYPIGRPCSRRSRGSGRPGTGARATAHTFRTRPSGCGRRAGRMSNPRT